MCVSSLDKQQLFEEKQKLQAAVEDALKTKENYRSTIKQLREENMGLQGQLSETSREKNGVGNAEKSTSRKVLLEFCIHKDFYCPRSSSP